MNSGYEQHLRHVECLIRRGLPFTEIISNCPACGGMTLLISNALERKKRIIHYRFGTKCTECAFVYNDYDICSSEQDLCMLERYVRHLRTMFIGGY